MVPNKDARIALYPTGAMAYAADRMRQNGDRTTDRRVTVLEAAKLLDLTPDAVRARLRRGTLRKERAEDGTLLVVLEGTDPDRPPSGRTTEQPTDPYINALKSQIAMLEQELEDRKEEARRKDAIMLNMTEAIKALNPPNLGSEPRESPETVPEERGDGGAPPEDQSPEKPVSSWWRRLFG